MRGEQRGSLEKNDRPGLIGTGTHFRNLIEAHYIPTQVSEGKVLSSSLAVRYARSAVCPCSVPSFSFPSGTHFCHFHLFKL